MTPGKRGRKGRLLTDYGRPDDHQAARSSGEAAPARSDVDKGKRYVAALELPPVDSPQPAVKAAIVDEAKKRAK